MQELARITITQHMDEDGELHFHVDVSDGTEFIRTIGLLETAKLELYDGLPHVEVEHG